MAERVCLIDPRVLKDRERPCKLATNLRNILGLGEHKCGTIPFDQNVS